MTKLEMRIAQITITAKTESGKKLELTSTSDRIVNYYKTFDPNSSRGTTLTLFKNKEGEWALSLPNYSNSKRLRVKDMTVNVEMIADPLADDSWLD